MSDEDIQKLAGGGAVHMPSIPHHMPMPSPSEIEGMMVPGDLPSGFTLDHAGQTDLPHGFELDEDKYGGIGGMAASAALGAASGLTLGGSNVLLTKSGLMSPETLKTLQETNPLSYGAGEIGSVFAPMGAASLIGKAGKATYQGLKALNVIKAADQAGMIAKGLGLGADVAAHAAGSAVEGALYAGVGNSVNEYALGDPDLNAEKIMGHIGHGALLGGAFGAALKTAAIGAPPALKAGTEALSNLKKTLLGSGHGEDSITSKALDLINPDGKLSDAFMNRAKTMGEEELSGLVRNVTGGLNTVKNNFETAQKDLNSVLRPAERASLIDTANPKKVLSATQDVIDQMNKTSLEMKLAPGEYSSDAVSKLDRWHTQLTNQLADQSPSARFDTLKEIKQGLQNWGYGFQSETKAQTLNKMKGISNFIGGILHDPDVFGFVGSSEAAHDSLLHEIYQFIPPGGGRAKEESQKEFKKLFLGSSGDFDSTKVKKYLSKGGPEGDRARELLDSWFDLQKKLPEHFENTYANVPNDLWDGAKLDKVMDTLNKTQGDVGLAQTEYQHALERHKGEKIGIKEMLLGGIGVSHPALGAVIGAIDVASRPIEYMNKLAEVERILGKSTDALGKGAKAAFVPTLKAIGKAKAPLIREMSDDDHKKIRDDLSQYNNNPRFLIDRLQASTGMMQDIAPNIAQGLQSGIMRANQFLASKIPVHEESPFHEDFDYSPTERANFERYFHVVENPKIAFSQMQHGTLGPETIETLNAVYPKLYGEMKTAVLKEATRLLAKKEVIPYGTKQQISMFLGVPIDSSLRPQSILSNQMAFMAMNQAEAQKGAMMQAKPSKSGMGKLDAADRSKLKGSTLEA